VPSNNNGNPTKGKVDGRRATLAKTKVIKNKQVKKPFLNDPTKSGFKF
jgi:hypothetical protein